MYIVLDTFFLWDYFLTSQEARKSSLEKAVFLIPTICKIASYDLQILVLVENCRKINVENRKISTILMNFCNIDFGKEFRYKKFDFLHQIESRSLDFKAAGILHINRPLIVTVAWHFILYFKCYFRFKCPSFPFQISGAATMYLIILVQFRLANINQENIIKSLNCSNFTHHWNIR